MRAYLLSAGPSTQPTTADRGDPQRIDRGRSLFIGLDRAGKGLSDMQGGYGCVGCHANRNETGVDWSDDGVSQRYGPELSTIGSKLLAGRNESQARQWLRGWLLDPRTHDPASLMPSLRLSAEDAADLSEYLLTQRATISVDMAPAQQGDPALGRQLIAHYGCMNCHTIASMESTPSPCPNLSDWGRKGADKLDFGPFVATFESYTRETWLERKLTNPRIYDLGRDALRPEQKLRMPNFDLAPTQIRAISTFILSNRPRLISEKMLAKASTEQSQRIAAGWEVLHRHNCVACHQIENETPPIQRYWTRFHDPADVLAKAPPTLRGLGARVQPSWLFNFLQDLPRETINGRIRPLPFIRMPSFALSPSEAATLVSFFNATAQRESQRLQRQLVAIRTADRWPADNWFATAALESPAYALRDWSIQTGRLKTIEFASSRSAADLNNTYSTALFDASFIADLYDAPYPFVNIPRPSISDERFGQGERFFQYLGCTNCHMMGNQRDPRMERPRGPNLALAHRRLQRRWIRHWVQETQIIQPGAIMPPFFSGRSAPSAGTLRGLPYATSPPDPAKSRFVEENFGKTVDEQIDLLMDYIYVAGAREGR